MIGLYSDMTEIEGMITVVVPVYATDPAILDPVIEHAKKTLASSVAGKQNNDLNDNSAKATSMPNGVSDNPEK